MVTPNNPTLATHPAGPALEARHRHPLHPPRSKCRKKSGAKESALE